MLKISTSRYVRDIEKRVFERAAGDHRENRRAYIMVPEQFTLQNEIKLMEAIDAQAVMDIRIMSFNRLAMEALSESGGLKRKYIDDIGKAMAVKRIFQSDGSGLSLYRGSIDKEGFVASLVRLMSEFKRTMINPAQLMEASEQNNSNILMSQKLSELAMIYQKFEASLSGKYIDNEDRIGQLSDIREMTHLEGTRLYFYSFFSFTEIENQVIRNMLRSGLDMEIFLNTDFGTAGDDADETFAITRKTLKKLTDMCEECGVRYEIEIIAQGESENEEIRHLGDNIFSTVVESRPEAPFSIDIYHAHNIDEEIRRTAADIIHNIMDNGYRYRDIMVIPCDPQRYNTGIKLIFKEYEIPFFIDEKRSIMSSPVIKTIISVLNLLDSRFRMEDLLLFLKNGFSGIGEDEANIFENHVIKRKFKGDMFFEDRYFEPEYFYEDEEEKTAVAVVRNYICSVFGPLRDISSKKLTAKEFAEKIFEILFELRLPEKLQEFVETLKKEEYHDEANENGQIWNVFLRIADQSVELLGDEKIEFSYYREILEQGIASHQLAVIPPSKDQVVIGDIERSRSMDKKTVYVLGADSTGMPRVSKESGLLSKEEKDLLAAQGIVLPSNQEHTDSNEALLIYNLITKPSHMLHMSYAADTGSGSAIPSSIMNQACLIYPGIRIKTARDLDAKYYITVPGPTISIMAGEIKRYAYGEEPDEIWLELLRYYLRDGKHRKRVDAAMAGIFYDNTRPPVGRELASELYRSPLKVSTTRIDSFARCPFSHFIKYGLKARQRKVYEIDPAEMGQVLHMTVEEFIAKLKENLPEIGTITREESDRVIGEIFERSAQELFKEHDLREKRNQHILGKLKKTAFMAGYSCVEQLRAGRFELMYQEERFAQGSEIPPLIFEIDGETIVLEGTIDRVDVLEDGERKFIKIIDYKTRSKAFSLSDAYNGLDIQLIVYLSAAMQSSAFIKNETYPAGVFYFPVINPVINTQSRDRQKIEELIRAQMKMDGIVLHDIKIIEAINGKDEDTSIKTKGRSRKEHMLELEEFDALISRVENRISEYLEEMISGVIEPSPVIIPKTGSKACDYCRYSSICRFDEELESDMYKKIPQYSNEEVIKKLGEVKADE